ncbi:MAG: hypothetical protein WAZ18_00035 [Alphaproteobacteria bacterium]
MKIVENVVRLGTTSLKDAARIMKNNPALQERLADGAWKQFMANIQSMKLEDAPSDTDISEQYDMCINGG